LCTGVSIEREGRKRLSLQGGRQVLTLLDSDNSRRGNKGRVAFFVRGGVTILLGPIGWGEREGKKKGGNVGC